MQRTVSDLTHSTSWTPTDGLALLCIGALTPASKRDRLYPLRTVATGENEKDARQRDEFMVVYIGDLQPCDVQGAYEMMRDEKRVLKHISRAAARPLESRVNGDITKNFRIGACLHACVRACL